MLENPVFIAVGWMTAGAAIALVLKTASMSGWKSLISDPESHMALFCGCYGAAAAAGGKIGIGLLVLGGIALGRFAYLHDQRSKQAR